MLHFLDHFFEKLENGRVKIKKRKWSGLDKIMSMGSEKRYYSGFRKNVWSYGPIINSSSYLK